MNKFSFLFGPRQRLRFMSFKLNHNIRHTSNGKEITLVYCIKKLRKVRGNDEPSQLHVCEQLKQLRKEMTA